MPNICVHKGAQLIATAFRLARVGIDLVQPPLPLDVREIDINEGRPYRHGLALEVPRNNQIVEFAIDDLHPDLLFKLQKVKNNTEALRANYDLTELPDLLLAHSCYACLFLIVDGL